MYVVLYCIVLYCIVLHCIALHCIVSYRIVSYRMVLYCIVYTPFSPSKPKKHTHFQPPSKTTHVFFFKYLSKPPFKNGVSCWCSWPFFFSFIFAGFKAQEVLQVGQELDNLQVKSAENGRLLLTLKSPKMVPAAPRFLTTKKSTMKWDPPFFLGGGDET